MKRFAAYTILVALISLIGFLLLDMFLLSFTHNGSYYSHEKNVGLAYHRLEELMDTNKIVIIGGSNGGFSINSELIHQAFNMPVVNTGTHASIGVRMQFEIYKDLLTKKQREIFSSYYLYDLSLSEIAEPDGKSRQSVYDSVKKVKIKLDGYESSLGVKKTRDGIDRLAAAVEKGDADLADKIRRLKD